MRTLLVAINAKYIHTSLSVRLLRQSLLQAGLPCEVKEYTINQPVGQILSDIVAQKPDVVCFSCYIWNREVIEAVANDLHRLFPQMPLVYGGPEASFAGEPFVLNPFVSYVVCGAGERALPLLLNAIYQGEELDGVPGLIYKKEGQIFRNPMETIPIPPSVQFPYTADELKTLGNKVFYYESSRGCPYACAYCLSGRQQEKLVFGNLDTTFAHLQQFLDAKVRQVNFVDRTFNCDSKRAVAIWEYLKAHDNGVTQFDFEIAGDLLDDAQLACLADARPGAFHLEIGVQTTNQAVLKEVARRQDLDRLANTVAKLQQAGRVHLHLDLIAGLPGEDFDSFGKSFDDLMAMGPHQLQLGFLKLLPGSPLAERANALGLVCSTRPPYEVLKTAQLSFEDLTTLKQIAFLVEKYGNSDGFGTLLFKTMADFKSSFAFYLAFARFFEAAYGFETAHSRFTLGQALLQFWAKTTKAKGLEQGEFWLLHDLLLRENLRSLPPFLQQPALIDATHRRATALLDTLQLPEDVLEQQRRTFARQSRVVIYPVAFAPTNFTAPPLYHPGPLPQGVPVLYDYRHRDFLGNVLCHPILPMHP